MKLQMILSFGEGLEKKKDDCEFSVATDNETMSSDGNSNNVGSSKSPYRKRVKNSYSSNNSSSNNNSSSSSSSNYN